MDQALSLIIWIVVSLTLGAPWDCELPKPDMNLTIKLLEARRNEPVYIVEKKNPGYRIPDIQDKNKFLNDLMLSPYWKVEKDDDGNYVAKARHLFDFEMKENRKSKYSNILNNKNGIYVTVKFGTLGKLESKDLYTNTDIIRLHVYNSDYYKHEIDITSDSSLLFKISQEHGIYLIIREGGNDKTRKATFSQTQSLLDELNELSKLPAQYHSQDKYSSFYKARFIETQYSSCLRRQPGIQGRDTFYGYFKTKKDVNYNGINIKISHPEYCQKNGECTSRRYRLDKAEYLGKTYFENDLVYFQIEDNAVYLSSEKFNKMFGYFSGKGKFKANLEILNEKGALLFQTYDMFTGWER